jgi:hypothetical protein
MLIHDDYTHSVASLYSVISLISKLCEELPWALAYIMMDLHHDGVAQEEVVQRDPRVEDALQEARALLGVVLQGRTGKRREEIMLAFRCRDAKIEEGWK